MRENCTKRNVILRFIVGNKSTYKLFLLTFLSIMLYSASKLTMSFFLGNVIDSALKEGIASTLKGFMYLLTGIICFTLIYWLYVFLFGKYLQKILFFLREDCIKTITGIPLTSMIRYSTGELISRVNNDLALIEDAFRNTFSFSIYCIITGLFATVLAFIIHWKMAIFAVIIPLIVGIISFYISKPIQEKQKELQSINGSIAQLSQDAIGGHVEIKSFNLYDVFITRLKKLTNKSIKKSFEIAKIDITLVTIIDCAGIGLQIGIVFVGLYFVIKSEITIGQMIIFQQIQEIMRLIFKIRFSDFARISAGLERIYEILDEKQEAIDGEVKVGNQDAPTISFRNVSFSYIKQNAQSQDKQLIKNISFIINKNESVALVGSSGCGKSTILKLICGLLEPDSGEIHYMGYLYNEWDKKALRNQISLVDQSTHLFPASIHDNIALGRIDAVNTDDMRKLVKQSAKLAGLDSYISTLEKGYDTEVGEWGAKLSGGQKQRVAIARAFIKDAQLLILDEPTSALDAQAELETQKSIEELMHERTTIIVAHRLSTIRNVDRIFVIDNGSIVEEGTHDSLILKKGTYYKLYQKQFTTDKEVPYGEREYISNY